ncbi:hypothetical protein NMG60_11026949 [Bertholletia excelsa]
MGNCMETSKDNHGGETELEEREKQERRDFEGGGVRVKIVLTKVELEWLMFQLKDREGTKLEDVLGELERGRGRALGWKPSLESIMESPEVPDQMDR